MEERCSERGEAGGASEGQGGSRRHGGGWQWPAALDNS